MAFISVDNNFTSSTLCDAGKVNGNFKNILNGLSDGTKDISINSLTASNCFAGGDVEIGADSSTTASFLGGIAEDVKAYSTSFTIGNTSYPVKSVYLDNTTTDGGAIVFNSNINDNIKATADGTVLNINNFESGVAYTQDGYFRMGVGEDLELTLSSDDAIIRNRTANKDISFYLSTCGVDTLYAHMDGSEKYMTSKAFVDGLEVNPIVNGQMLIWQRDTSFTNIADQNYFADNFQYVKNGTMNHTVSRYTLTSGEDPYNEGYRYATKMDVTTSSTLSNSHYVGVRTGVEGYDTVPFYGKECNISFWIKSTKTGTVSLSLHNSGTTANYIQPVTISASSAWEKKVVTFTMATYTSASWSNENTLGMEIYFSLGAGASTTTDSSGTWITSGEKADTNQINTVDNSSNEVYLTGVRMGIGDGVNTVNQSLSFLEELNRCERYYEKSYNYDTPVSTVTGSGVRINTFLNNNWVFDGAEMPFVVNKRTATTSYFFTRSDTTGAKDRVNKSGSEIVSTTLQEGNDRFQWYDPGGGGTAGNLVSWYWEADASLFI